MTELQVKTKKGSLKKFLAMFLAVCVCMTTFQLNGMFAKATGENVNIKLSAETMSLKVGESKDSTATVDVSGGDSTVTPGETTPTPTVTPSDTTTPTPTVSPSNAAQKVANQRTTVYSSRNVTGDSSSQTVAWTVKDPSKKIVDISAKGNTVSVKGLAKGEAVVVATIGENVTAECKVTVADDGGKPSGTPTPTPGAGTGTATQTPTPTPGGGTGTATQTPAPTKAPVKVKKVELSAKKLYVVAKKSVTVGVSVQPSDAKNKAVTWKSKNTKVATVNSKGKITAKNAAGKDTKITATAKDGSKKSATVTVYVVKKAVKVSSVKLPKTAKVDVKGTVALKTTIKPAKATMDSKTLKWTTSDKKVATVSNGVVTGKKAGVATITVKAGKKSAKCVVTVTKKGVKATLKPAKATIKVKQKYQIKLKGKGDKITSCKSSNTKVATVTKSGKITGKKAGKADITVVTKKGGVATFKVTVKKK